MRWIETRECRRLTWPARLTLLALLVGLSGVWALTIHDFLARTAPIDGEYLVVEAWLSDHGLRKALGIYRSGNYRKMIIVGTQPHYNNLRNHRESNAVIAARAMRALDLPAEEIVVIDHPPVGWDRTYRTAIALRDWFANQNTIAPRLDLASADTHARRSQLLYRMAMGEDAQIGIYAIPNPDYDATRWWASSAGVRAVVTEFIGWLYVKAFFYP